MGKDTNIEWCDSTVNPTSGCDGCELFQASRQDVATCYASHLHTNRLAKTVPEKYAPNFEQVRLIPGRMQAAANWPDLRGKERPGKPWMNGRPRFIFVGDMGDFLSAAVPDEYILNEIFGAIRSVNGRRHVWCLLTKRPERLANISRMMWGGLPDNCIAMTTVTSQRTALVRVPHLLRVICAWRGLSCEPLLDRVELAGSLGHWTHADGSSLWLSSRPGTVFHPSIHWVICGGESGRLATPMQADSARLLRDQCESADVAYFFKQWGEHDAGGRRVGKAGAGRVLDGREWNEMPEIMTEGGRDG